MIVRIALLISIFAPAAMAGLLPRSLGRLASPATQPDTPVQTCTAKDLPLHLDGTVGNERQWLESFDVPAHFFDYTIQLTEDDNDLQVYRVVYASPFVSPFPEDNTVPAEFYLPKKRPQKVPAAIVLDIMQGSAFIPRGLARGLASQGVAAIYFPMAYYNARRPKNNAHIQWIDSDPSRALGPVRQTVMDVRRAKAILVSRPEIDPTRIGITGVSLGGIMTSIAAGVDGQFWRVCPILAGGDLPDLIFNARETRRVKENLVAKGFDEQKLGPIMAPVEPLHFANRIESSRCLMINAAKDEVIPKVCTMDLWTAIGKPTLLWLPSGHYGAALYLPTIKQTAIDFLKGRPVTKLEF